MSLPNTYNQQFIDYFKQSNQAFTDATPYGIQIVPLATAADNQAQWRIIGIHHLTGAENGGQHHLFCDVLDEAGQRINGATLTVQNNDLPPATITIDKPAHEPGSNAQMYWDDNLSISVNWEGLASEKAVGFNTRHPDEDPGTTLGHHSFYVVFQKTTQSTPPPNGSSLEALLWSVGGPLIQPLNPDAALYKKARDLGLREHLTGEYEVVHKGNIYVAQIYQLGLVYVLKGHWDQVKVIYRTGMRQKVDTPPSNLQDYSIIDLIKMLIKKISSRN